MQNSQKCSESSNSNRGAYLEIYKLQIDTITKISDRRVNVSRYYIFAISALILALSVVSSSDFLDILKPTSIESAESVEKSKDASEVTESINFAMGITGLLGFVLTLSWILNMLGYLTSSTKRYKKIKDLESRLPYQFTESMWESTLNGATKKYFDFASHELLTPFLFCIAFTMLSLYGFCQFFPVDSKNEPYIFWGGLLSVFVLLCVIRFRRQRNV